MTNKATKQVSNSANCVTEKSRFLKQKSDAKSSWERINPNFFIY